MKKLKQYVLVLVFVLLTAINAFSANVTLQWDANTESDLAGYKVYYDVDSGAPYNGSDATEGTSPIIIPIGDLTDANSPEFTLNGFDGYNDHYFVVTAYDNEVIALESDYSNEVIQEKIYETGPPSSPKNLTKIWKMVKKFLNKLDPRKANLKIKS